MAEPSLTTDVARFAGACSSVIAQQQFEGLELVGHVKTRVARKSVRWPE